MEGDSFLNSETDLHLVTVKRHPLLCYSISLRVELMQPSSSNIGFIETGFLV